MTHVDVLVVGAGISGIGAGYRLQTRLPGKTYTILEARDTIGGTWDLFRYPGIRSDSDMFTLSYPFRPWHGRDSIADGPSILEYVRAAAKDYGVDRRIRFGHRVVRASWSNEDALWTVEAEHDGEPVTFTCSFLYLCSGYYDYAGGHVVDFPGREEFRGPVIHPQHWPDDLDYRNKRIVVIGSGATAVTLVPALAEQAAHVTMLQRSPSYVVTRPSTTDKLTRRIQRFLPSRLAHHVVRGRNVVMSTLFYQMFRRLPERSATFLRDAVAQQVQGAIDVDPHFTPKYRPWDQRLCLVPDGDLFAAIREHRADVVTDHIDTFTDKGIRLESGEELAADIIVTATGLRLVPFGDIELTVNGTPVNPSDTTVYKGMMLSGVPNFAWCVGYTNNSWTLRADLVAQYVCRLLGYMDRHHHQVCVPAAPTGGHDHRPLLDLTSGYVQRAAGQIPQQGTKPPWLLRQNYLLDLAAMRLGRVDDDVMRFGRI